MISSTVRILKISVKIHVDRFGSRKSLVDFEFMPFDSIRERQKAAKGFWKIKKIYEYFYKSSFIVFDAML